jgi:dTDP-L-rhamnose 4-epimerase
LFWAAALTDELIQGRTSSSTFPIPGGENVRALVTGGAGFIGSHIVDRFLREGYQVRIIDDLDGRVHPNGLPRYLAREVEFIKGSVTDRTTWERGLEGVDIISHQAAYQDYMLDFSTFLQVNAVSTALLYEVLVERRLRPKKIIIASSQAVYGEGQYLCPTHGLVLPKTRSQLRLQRGSWEVPCPQCNQVVQPQLLQETHPNPFNQYAVSKLAGEKIALGLGSIHQIPSVALRYSITQGPRQSLYNQYSGVLRIFAARALAGNPIIIYEDGRQTRDFVHIDDVVDANFCVLDSEQADYEAFNVGSGTRVNILDYADAMVKKIGKNVQCVVAGQYRVGDNRHSVSSVEKLERLGWRPLRDLSQIQNDFLAWLDEVGGVPSNISAAYDNMCANGVVRAMVN